MSRAPYNTLIIPYLTSDDAPLFCLLKRSDNSSYQFIAGGGEDSETPLEAAVREAHEETGILVNAKNWITLDSTCSVPRAAFPNAPWPQSIHVVTEYSFAVEVTASDITLSGEHTEFTWLPYQDCIEYLQFDSNKTALYELGRRLGIEPN